MNTTQNEMNENEIDEIMQIMFDKIIDMFLFIRM